MSKMLVYANSVAKRSDLSPKHDILKVAQSGVVKNAIFCPIT